MKICWIRCQNYDEAKNFHGVVYLHEQNGRPFYWGICGISVFGGNPRKVDGMPRNPRYGTSYRHWIEGCLRHAGALYIGTPAEQGNFSLQDIELTLIAMYPSEMNVEEDAQQVIPHIEHQGDVPSSIRG